jgi:acyl carrier protein
VRGSGPQGAVVAADLEGALEDVTAPSDDDGRVGRRRQIIAAAMARSKREIPHYYLATSIDIQGAVDWLAARNEGRPVDEQLLLPALLVKSVAQAARRFPQLNGHWRDDGFEPADTVDVGMVTSLRAGGLVVPTLRDADRRSVSDLTRQLRDVVGRARAGRLRSGELGEATITVTSLGEHGAESIFGVIYPPQVAIVGFGAAHPEVRAEGDLHGTRLIIHSTLAADHRASDGRQGSRFLEVVAQALLDPEELCAEGKTTAAVEADTDATVEADSDEAVYVSTSQPISDDFASIRRQVFEAIIEVAPDLSADDLASSADLHDDLGLDSIDLANIMAAMAKRTSYAMSESWDAPVRSVEDLVRWVVRLAEERDASP